MADATLVRTSPIPDALAQDAVDWRGWLIRCAHVVNLLLRGRAALTVTLAAGATTSVIYDSRISLFSAVLAMPQTATAATAFASGSFYIVPAAGQATINHPNTADVDKTFILAVIG